MLVIPKGTKCIGIRTTYRWNDKLALCTFDLPQRSRFSFLSFTSLSFMQPCSVTSGSAGGCGSNAVTDSFSLFEHVENAQPCDLNSLGPNRLDSGVFDSSRSREYNLSVSCSPVTLPNQVRNNITVPSLFRVSLFHSLQWNLIRSEILYGKLQCGIPKFATQVLPSVVIQAE